MRVGIDSAYRRRRKEKMNGVKTTLLMTAMTALLVLIGRLIGGTTGMIVALIFAGIMNFFSYWFSDRIVLAMYRAQEADPRKAPKLYGAVEKLSSRLGLPMPRIYVIPTDSPNAFATGRNPSHAAVAATRGILQILDDDELEAVLGHELSHVTDRDILVSTLAATMAGAVTLLAIAARWTALFGGFGGGNNERGGGVVGLLAMAILAPIAALLIRLAISRTREYMADSGGARLTKNPLALARALEKLDAAARRRPLPASPSTAHLFIVNPLRSGFMVKLFSTHPPTEKRVERLREMALTTKQERFQDRASERK
jgi:heat shock protein HtpX